MNSILRRRRGMMGRSDIVLDGANMTWEQGLISNTTGLLDGTNLYYISTSNFIRVINPNYALIYDGPTADSNNVKYNVYVFQYTSDKSLIGRFVLNTVDYGNTPVVLESACAYIKISFGHVSSSGVNMNMSNKADFHCVGKPLYSTWENTGFDLSNFTDGQSSAHTYNSTQKTLRIYSTANGTYRGAGKSFSWSSGYAYLVEYDLTYVKGTHKAAFTIGDVTYGPSSANITESTHVKYYYNRQDQSINKFKLFCTWSSNQAGDCTVSNFSIKRRKIPV